jgi:hypothetical protein
MSKFLNGLQTYEAKSFKGAYAQEDTLNSMMMLDPKGINYTLNKVYANNPAMELINFVEAFPTMVVNGENDMFNYKVKGKDSNALILIDVETEAGLSLQAGTLSTPISSQEYFYLRFEKPLASQTQILRNPSTNYQFHVISEVKDATGTKYQVVANTEPGQTFNIPLDEMQLKGRWVVIGGTAADHFSDKGMELGHFATNYEMAFRISKMRMQYAVSGAMIDQGKNYPLRVPFAITDLKNGGVKEVQSYVNALEMAAMMEFKYIKAKSELFSKKNWDAQNRVSFLDKNGQKCPTPYGLFEQVVNYNKLKYNTFDLDYLTDVILTRMINKRSRNARKVKLITSEYGAIQFHKAVDAKVGTSNVTIMNDLYLKAASASNTGASNPTGFGYQHTSYRSVNGIDFEVVIADWLSDRELFPQPHPNGGLGNAEGYTYYIMSGEMGSESGIYKLRPNTSSLPSMGMIPGMRDPFTAGGQGRPKTIVSPIDGYEVHYMDVAGLAMLDPDALVELKLAV